VKPEDLSRVPPPEDDVEDVDQVGKRPIGTRSFVYGAKTLATALVGLVLRLLTGPSLMPAFWVLLAAGALGVMFSLIERTTTTGAEVVSHRRVNLDVVATVVFAAMVCVVVAVATD
jgi:hypothetical protein